MRNVIARTNGYTLLHPAHLSTNARNTRLLYAIQIEPQEIVIEFRRNLPVKGEGRRTAHRSPKPTRLAIGYLSACRSIPAAEEDCRLAAPHRIAAARPRQRGIVHRLSK